MISWKKPSVNRDLVAPFEASSDKKEVLQAYGTDMGRSSVSAYGQTKVKKLKHYIRGKTETESA